MDYASPNPCFMRALYANYATNYASYETIYASYATIYVTMRHLYSTCTGILSRCKPLILTSSNILDSHATLWLAGHPGAASALSKLVPQQHYLVGKGLQAWRTCSRSSDLFCDT